MTASLCLTNLRWSAPDGAALFSDLTISFGPERTGIVGRNGAGKSTLLRLIAGDLAPQGGQSRRAGSIAMMRQEAMSRPGDTIADLFGARPALALLDRAAAGLADAAALAEADWTLPARIEAALLRCDLAADPRTRLATLSGGQRSRAALAAAIFAEPDFLLLDEPTNNLDRAGRQAVVGILSGWTGGAIVASHDRALLEEMDTIVELTSLGAARYGGNYSAFRQRKELDLQAAQHDLAEAERARAEAARRAQQAANRKARKDSAGHKSRARGGQPKILLDAAKARAEASGGAGQRLREARREAAEAALTTARDRVEILQPLRMDIAATGLAPGRMALRLDRVSAGHDPNTPVIRDLSLTVTGPERLRIAGPNGSGKSTLLRLIAGQIAPLCGVVDRPVAAALLDQHVDLLDPASTLHDTFRRVNPAADMRMAHAALARFGFRAGDALRTAGSLSGGERLRAGLACTLGASPPPMLLMLDEPTNHLDLDGIAALESALAGYDGALLVVSHDDALIAALAPGRTIHLAPD